MLQYVEQRATGKSQLLKPREGRAKEMLQWRKPRIPGRGSRNPLRMMVTQLRGAGLIVTLICGWVRGQTSSDGSTSRVVSSSSGASDLADYLSNSSHPVKLDVEWRQHVTIVETIPVSAESTLTIRGSGDAVIDGGGSVRLFTVSDGATLRLTGLLLRGGAANEDGGENGGAVLVDGGSLVTATNCSFSENRVNASEDSSAHGGEYSIPCFMCWEGKASVIASLNQPASRWNSLVVERSPFAALVHG